MYKQLALVIIILSTSDVSAIAQPDASGFDPSQRNQSPEVMRAVQQFNTPEKVAAWLRAKHNVSVAQQWPSNFPVPAYQSNVVSRSFSNSTKGQPFASASLVTKDPPKRVFDFYQASFSRANWKLQVPSEKARTELKLDSNTYFFNGTQGRQAISFRCMKDARSGDTLVAISWRKD